MIGFLAAIRKGLPVNKEGKCMSKCDRSKGLGHDRSEGWGHDCSEGSGNDRFEGSGHDRSAG